jgi:hypothetical protein
MTTSATLTIAPAHWYSWNFDVLDGARRLAQVDVSSWREKGVVTIDGVEHRVYREGALGDFILERTGTVLARATKPSAFRHTMIVTYQGREYELRKSSAWRRTFVVLDGDTQIGSLSPNSTWTRQATVDLPAKWPLAVRTFVIWLAIILWKRDANAGA